MRTAELQQKLATLREYRGNLAGWVSGSRDEFAEDPQRVAAARYAFQTIIECARDLNDALLAEQAGVSARSHEDAFRQMAARGLLPVALAERFREHCRLRNRIVHQYNELSADAFHATAGRLVRDAEEYARHIAPLIGLGRREAAS